MIIQNFTLNSCRRMLRSGGSRRGRGRPPPPRQPSKLRRARERTMDGMTIRDSTEADIAAIQRIYAHHVLHGTASFEEEPPDDAEMARRRDELLRRGYPHLVATRDGNVLGYSYAGPYRTRAAYRY